MREFFLLPAVVVISALVAAVVLALSVFIVLPALIGIGVLFWIGERRGWARMGGLHRDDDAGYRDDA